MTNTYWNQHPRKIDVFLVDSNKFFRQGMRAALSQHMDIQIRGESDTDANTFDLIQTILPQIAIIDVNPPLLSGIDLTRQIAQCLPDTSIIVLTPYFNDDELVKAITAGAAAYLSKNIESNELANLIRRTADGELPVVENLLSNPSVLERVLRHFQSLSLKGRSVDSMHGPITEREMEVLSYAACGYGNKQIASALGISEQTIKNHMTSIMSKLDASDRTHAVVMALEHGWISTSSKTKQETDSPTRQLQ